jgi:hypothetical protein
MIPRKTTTHEPVKTLYKCYLLKLFKKMDTKQSHSGDTTLCDQVCQWLTTGQWFSPGALVSSTNKTDRQDITEILLKVALNPIKQTTITHNVSGDRYWLHR